ncbi:MAG: nucleotide exchange factor GrpE [Deltaproteobacteria bacterium]|nr:nucleotide exchange factor GrpE [Deltaproteobacteria bacterium]
MSTFDPQRRQQLLETLAQWVDDLAEAEPSPPGAATDEDTAQAPAPDLFTLLSQLTALTRETQLQGRATNRLHTELTGKMDTMNGQIESLGGQVGGLESVVRKVSDVRREARLEVISEILDVRDRFVRGLEEAQRRLAAIPRWSVRFAQRPVLEALVQGNALACERLDDVLRRFEVREIACLGKPFNPTLMQASEVAQTTEAAPGTVLAVFRAGYTTGDRVLRFADVKVATS